MNFWLREVAGWILVLLGLFVFYICYRILMLDAPWLTQAFYLTVIGVVLFRSGIHLLKVAMAVRVCLHARAKIAEDLSHVPSPRPRFPQRPR